MSANYVAKGIATCPVCGQEHTNSVLIKKRWSGKPLEDQKTGYQMCPEHQKLFDDGYIALVEIDETKSDQQNGVFWRTGNVIHLKRHIFDEIFDIDVSSEMPICHVDSEVMQILQEMYDKAQDN